MSTADPLVDVREARRGWCEGLAGPRVTMPDGVPLASALTPEGVARFATVTHADAPAGWVVTGTAVYSGAVGEWCVNRGQSSTIGGPSRYGRLDVDAHASRAPYSIGDWTDIGAGVWVASVAERDWTGAP